jgi:hypothetical protein
MQKTGKVEFNVRIVPLGMSTILDEASIWSAQRAAQQVLEKDRFLGPILRLLLEDGSQAFVSFVNLPGDPDEKYAALQQVGMTVAQMHGAFSEAVFVSEAWMVVVPTDKLLDLSKRPSQDPKRKEVLIVVGKNVSGSISKLIIQPFSHDEQKIKWGEPILSENDSSHFTSLLDALFTEYRE